MYSIAEFSKINRITQEALRRCDRIGLLKPATTVEGAGYRCSRAAQLPATRQTLVLKDLGCSLQSSRMIVRGGADADRVGPAVIDQVGAYKKGA